MHRGEVACMILLRPHAGKCSDDILIMVTMAILCECFIELMSAFSRKTNYAL